MSLWSRLGDFLPRAGAAASFGVGELVETVRTIFAGDAETRRKVAFSVAMIALSAKMAKADGIVTQDEIRAFREIFAVPPEEARNVARLYDLAKRDVAGFDVYARRLAGLCGNGKPDCRMLEDVLDGLFHVAKADGVLHRLEGAFLHEVARIFRISEDHYRIILARHVENGEMDPYAVLGIEPGKPFEEVRRHYRRLVASNHPDRLIARGLPEEFVAIATTRIAAINAAYEMIERGMRHL